MTEQRRAQVNLEAFAASEKFLAERGGAESPLPMREHLPVLVARAYEAGYRRAYQNMRIALKVAGESVLEQASRCAEEEGDEHQAATMEIWP